MFQLSFFFNVSISCFIHSVYYTRVDKECQAYNDINLFVNKRLTS
jgi:hypothetical protein